MLPFKKKQLSTLVGLEWQDRHIDGALVRRNNGAAKIERLFRIPLALDPLTHDPELAGRELRQRLDETGIRERHCVVGIPQSWVLATQTRLPDLEGEDLADFLQLHAEKNFPYPPEDLSISVSRAAGSGGERYATMLAVPKQHLALLERVLKAARLKPVSFTLGISALQPARASSESGHVVVAAGDQDLGLQVSAGGGVISLRVLKNAFHTNGAGEELEPGALARDLRITLGRLPNDLRRSVRQLKIFGRAPLSRLLEEEIAPHAERLGLVLDKERWPENRPIEEARPLESGRPAAALAARHLEGKPTELEFLPPKESVWQTKLARFSSGKARSLGMVGGGLIALTVIAFIVQHIQLSRIEDQWRLMEPAVTEIDALQEQIRAFRPWFDTSFRSLAVLNLLAEVFPEDSTVSAQKVEIRGLNMISCSGRASDPTHVIRAVDRLRDNPQVADLKIEHMRGTPVQFLFTFRWIEGAQ